MIHCDEVFDILTRGPFPTGAASDGIVESHLAQCASCKQLAEALRPALELFQESVTPEESRKLPSYWGAATATMAPWMAASEAIATRAEPDAHKPARLLHTLTGYGLADAARFAVGIVLGMILMVGAYGIWQWKAGDREHRSALAGTRARLTAAGHQTLAALQLPMACLVGTPLANSARHTPTDESARSASQSSGQLGTIACCTTCHASGRDAPPPEATVRIVQACQACHYAP